MIQGEVIRRQLKCFIVDYFSVTLVFTLALWRTIRSMSGLVISWPITYLHSALGHALELNLSVFHKSSPSAVVI